MSEPHPPTTSTTTSTSTSNLLTTQSSLLKTLTTFLTVCIHHILFLRFIYPPISFLPVRAYNYPVRQNRHPAVCDWIISAVGAIHHQLEKGVVEKIALCIFECESNQALERWTFDMRELPVVGPAEMDTVFEGRAGEAGGAADVLENKINVADLEAHFRAVLGRLSSAAARLKPLPAGKECSYTVTMEVKDDADRPVGRLDKEERKWVAAEPEPWTSEASWENNGLADEGVGDGVAGKTVPVRRLEVGELRIEVWVEESKAKFEELNKNQRNPV